LGRLEEAFFDSKQGIGEVYGIGSALDESKTRVPIVIVDRAFAPESLRRPSFPDLSDRVRPGDIPPKRSKAHILPLQEAGKRTQALLSRWELPNDAQVLFSMPLKPLTNPGPPIWCGKKTATLGFPFAVDTERPVGVTTAGHFVDNRGVVVSVRTGFWDEVGIGSVSFHNDPLRQAGVDAAAIKLWPNAFDLAWRLPWYPLQHHWLRRRWYRRLLWYIWLLESIGFPPWAQDDFPRWVLDPLPPAVQRERRPPDGNRVHAVVLGARSGLRYGWLEGSAFPITRSHDGRVWRNTWLVLDTDPGIAVEGDSGGVVGWSASADRPRAGEPIFALGHLVCGLGVRRRRGRFQSALVQDLETIVAYLSDQYQAPIRIPRVWAHRPPTIADRARSILSGIESLAMSMLRR
jgi:hypothetical protein